MSITDELREYVSHYSVAGSTKDKLLTALADRIDAEHEKAMSRAGQLLADAEKDRDYNYANWQECKQKVLQGNITIDELNARIEFLEDALLHCIERPKDADGEDIHIGDVMEWCNGSFTVHELKLTEDGWQTWDSEHGYTVNADECIHHHAPTVEDVVTDLCEHVWEAALLGGTWSDSPVESYIADFSKRLKLAGDEE